jgi:hypothetical protein
VGAIGHWWLSLSTTEKRYLGAGLLGLAGVGVWALALSRRDADEDVADPRVTAAVSQALGQFKKDADPNDVADVAYWTLYPECPEYLDPKRPEHDLCIRLWLDVRDEARFQLGCGRHRPNLQVYPPGSQKQVDLFRRAARLIGVPEAWASDPALRFLIAHESGGVVGVPNYTWGWRAREAACWPSIHRQIQSGLVADARSATGLGQLKVYTKDYKGKPLEPGHGQGGVDTFYPSGRAGIGNPLEEAAGMLNYIRARYGTPKAARACYGKAPCQVPGHATKTFKEGY